MVNYLLKLYTTDDNIATVDADIRTRKNRFDGDYLRSATMHELASMRIGLYLEDAQRAFRRGPKQVDMPSSPSVVVVASVGIVRELD